MHKRFVTNIVSRIILVACGLMILPLMWAVLDDPQSLEVKAFLGTMGLGLFTSGVILARFQLKK
ncbi:MAG: hypothetical protein K8I00_10910, partial [Candidatus Omnitrophica bacterium]|nr:hypothetical protein [Candidatus Omnitrophota bacterium]